MNGTVTGMEGIPEMRDGVCVCVCVRACVIYEREKASELVCRQPDLKCQWPHTLNTVLTEMPFHASQLCECLGLGVCM